MHIYTICSSLLQSFTKFCGVALTQCFGSIFHFGQISKLKKGIVLRNTNWIKIFCGYAHLHIMSFITAKFQEILLSGFRGVALTRKTGLMDWLTDGRTGQKHYKRGSSGPPRPSSRRLSHGCLRPSVKLEGKHLPEFLCAHIPVKWNQKNQTTDL